MYSSQNNKRDIILAIYQSSSSVFRLKDVAMLTGETEFQSLNRKLNYYVRTGKLLNPRKGIYAKPGYNPEEAACIIYTPSYISLQYVLQQAGIIFQYDTRITSVSTLSRSIRVGERQLVYRKIRSEYLVDTSGINRRNDHVNIAMPERAFLDMLYLDKEAYFDNLNPLQKEKVYELLPLYHSRALEKRVHNILQNG